MAGEDLEDAGFWLERTDVGGINVVTVTHFEGEVFAEACSTPQETTTEEIERSASALVAFLAEREGIDATEPAHVNVGGHHAVQIDLTTALPAACTDPAWIWLWVIQAVGDFHFNDAEQARVIALDVGETTVVIVAEAFPDADYDAFLTASTELIESMTIEP